VEAHVAACGDCARAVERVRAEARRIAAALETTVPAGLASSILDAATPASSGGFRFTPGLGAAAAALFAVTAAWAWNERSAAMSRMGNIEKELAALKARGPEKAPEAPDIDEILRQMARVEIEGEIGIIVGTVDSLSPEHRDFARSTLLGASDTMSETLARIAQGKIDPGALQSTDTFAGLNDDLRARLEPDEYRELIARIETPSKAAAAAFADSISGDLQAIAQLDSTQTSALRKLVNDGIGWRRDLNFLPDPVKSELACRSLGTAGSLRPEVEKLLNAQQKSRVLSYLASAETERTRYWENLRNKSKY
ncbi:MAG: hypothetical protein IT452_21220, partial [Planctomycetia bacterium]|nr:hypothetical protein [Planctomycetia bacterium]